MATSTRGPGTGAGSSPATGGRAPGLTWLDVVTPVAVLAVEVLVQVAFVHAMLRPDQAAAPAARWTIWDGRRYLGIAEHGYPGAVRFAADGTVPVGEQYAFFPVYPLLVRLAHAVLPFGWAAAGLTVSALAAAALAVLVHQLVRALGAGRAASLAAVAGLGMLPMSVVFTMAYAESVFAALSVAVLLAVLRGRPAVALLLAVLCALTRPTAVLLLVPLLACAVVHRTRRTPCLAAAAGLVVGLAGWWGFVASVAGRLDALSEIQARGWGTRFDAGSSTWRLVRGVLTGQADTGVTQVAVVLCLLGFLAATVALLLGRHDRWLALYGLGVLALVVGESNYWHSKPRLLLAGAVLLAPAAAGLERAGVLRRPQAWVVGVVLLLASAWFGAWMLDVWPYAI